MPLLYGCALPVFSGSEPLPPMAPGRSGRGVIYPASLDSGTMVTQGSAERWDGELRALREELQRMRAEQREMATAIQELVTTFRTLATHLGIASEPYTRKSEAASGRDIPGFG
jgi:hypothetical protein